MVVRKLSGTPHYFKILTIPFPIFLGMVLRYTAAAGFDADWGSPGALANLAANGSADQGEDTAGRGETGPNED